MATKTKARPRSRATNPDTSCVYVVRFVRADGSEPRPRRLMLPADVREFIKGFNRLCREAGCVAQARRIELPSLDGKWEGRGK